MRSVVIIPARYQSSRFPGKPLISILGKPLILWVAELSEKAVGRENVYIATDDQRIADTILEAGFSAVMTSSLAATGTDRLAEAAETIEADIYLNVQGDEPLLDPEDICKVRDAKLQMPDTVINGFCWLSDTENPNSINIPKLVTTPDNKLIYMYRQALPGYKDQEKAPDRYKKQVCIYAFNLKELSAFAAHGRKTPLEEHEDIEILRLLELGQQVQMVETAGDTLAVDVPEDVANVEAALLKRQNG